LGEKNKDGGLRFNILLKRFGVVQKQMLLLKKALPSNTRVEPKGNRTSTGRVISRRQASQQTSSSEMKATMSWRRTGGGLGPVEPRNSL